MPSMPSHFRTLYDKIFDDHVVDSSNGMALLYIDRHLVHEVTSPQAFEGLRNAGRKVRRVDCTLSTVDHNIPTTPRTNFKSVSTFIEEDMSRLQVETLEQNVKDFNVRYFGMDDARQGIVHIIGPEQGFTLPGTTIVCGDSHTATHGAFGALAFGIGTSEVEHVLATQTIIQAKSTNMLIRVDGKLGTGVTSKDLILHIIGEIGTAGGTGAVIEFAGEAIRDLSMEARMSICNMAIEGGARAGLIAPDQTTFDYLKNRPLAPKGDELKKALEYWKTLHTDDGAKFDTEVIIKAKDVIPTVTWGTSPQDALPINGSVPDPAKEKNESRAKAIARSLEYMGLKPNTPLKEIQVDKVFIGSCTNARMEDIRAAASIVRGKKIASNITRAMVVPGSGLIKRQAEKEGLNKIFEDAGFEWREAGCSMCLGMNPDILSPKERCASTSNRNFEGRQGAGGRTHLVSPPMAAAAAITGHLTDVRDLLPDGEAAEQATAATTVLDTDNAVAADENQLSPQDKKYDIPPDHEVEDEALARKEAKEAKQEPDSTVRKDIPTGIPVFTQQTGIAAPLDMENVDTDAIIPKQFLKTIKRTGLSVGLFYERRFKILDNGEKEKTDFILNVPPYDKAKFLVVSGANFGCGSSREHAPWALWDFGIHGVIAPSFGDIFYNNSYKNGLPCIRIDKDIIINKIRPLAKDGKPITVDLVKQEIRNGEDESQVLATFEIEELRRHCLLNGLDDIGITLQKEDLIRAYEDRRAQRFSWLEGGSKLVKPIRPTKRARVQATEW